MPLRSILFALGLTVAAGVGAAAEELLPKPELGPDGLWVETFYRTSTGDLAKDLALAAGEGKVLAIFWERNGCEFCLRLHTEDLRSPTLHGYVADKFYSIRMNFYGDVPVKDFDGATLAERDLAKKHRALGTPTMEFRINDGKAREVLRIPGYVEPETLQAAFEFVDTGGYQRTTIGGWLKERGLF